jgi:uncharacterized Fe-S cluster-containing radical SAM superfamily protein
MRGGGLDPVKTHLMLEKHVTRDHERKYYRFRVDRWYGGIVTADCVGCGLFCKFCWVSDNVRLNLLGIGRFYRPEDVASRLLNLARSRGISQVRISGGEPTIGREHLLRVLDHLSGKDILFILETNGILLGHDEGYAAQLSGHDFLHVRVSLKGCDESEFHVLTGADPSGFKLQLNALRNLLKAGVSCHPAIMTSFSSGESFKELLERFAEIDGRLAEEAEIEELILYPHVVERLKKYGLRYRVAHTPDKVPPDQI